jgi:hypothetical protein
MRAIWLCPALMVSCCVAVACGSTERQAENASAPTTVAGVTSTPDNEPLYGLARRIVPGVPQPHGEHPRRHEWYLTFPNYGATWNGVLTLSYAGKKQSWGRGYAYVSDVKTLRLTAEMRIGSIRPGVIDCPGDETATYAWSQFDNGYTLRLKATDEPCAVRRSVLEGDWHFID